MPNRTVRASATALPKARPAIQLDGPTEADFIDDLSALPKRYGMIVTGDCLAPLVPDGEIVLVDKTLPYAPGDLVVIYRRREATPDGKFQGLVKRLAMAPPPWVTFPWRDHPKSDVAALVIVETINPRQQLFYRCADLLGIHRCLGVLPPDVKAVKTSFSAAARRAIETVKAEADR